MHARDEITQIKKNTTVVVAIGTNNRTISTDTKKGHSSRRLDRKRGKLCERETKLILVNAGCSAKKRKEEKRKN